MSDKPWGGRFKESTSLAVEAYTESISFDSVLYAQDIAGSKAHARMLGEQGVITREEAATLISGLDQVKREIEEGSFPWKQELEDVHMNIETRLTQIVGEVGKKLHTGRSRNDQVCLDFRLFVSDQMREWMRLARALVRVFVKRAEENRSVLLPGCTHMQPAQPVSLAHHLLAYAWMFRRDCMRLDDVLKRVRISPLGSAALAGTTYPLDPQSVADEVGFDGIYGNSMDAVSDRDFVLEALFAGSCIMAHLSRLCEELIIWANPAFGFVQLSDGYSTGSSIMPQKKNPDVTELIRGKTGRVYGDLNTLLVMMKGLPLAYNKDMQEDKEAIFDAVDTLELCLKTITPMLDTMKTLPANMRRAAAKGFINATDCADYLTKKGMPFRDAYKLTGCMVSDCIAADKTLEELTLTQFQSYSPLFGADIYDAIDLVHCCEGRTSYGGPSAASVEKQIALATARLDAWEEENA